MERKSRRKNKGRQIKILDGDSRDTYTHKLRGRIIRSDPSRLTQSGRREGKRTGLHIYLPTYIRPFIHAQSLRTDRQTHRDRQLQRLQPHIHTARHTDGYRG